MAGDVQSAVLTKRMKANKPKTAENNDLDRKVDTAKTASLETFREREEGTTLTSDQGIPIPHTDDSLHAGLRGSTLLEDFHFREKMTRFDHERIPERVVHARGAGFHGIFELSDPLTDLTVAKVLTDTSKPTPVFVRFSTVGGSRGSSDLARDVRGFAVKFYTDEGNWDLVGNNIPVFFIQDGIKFPDLIHAVKPEPQNEIPQAATAHDTFWDFISLVPEAAHMVMWIMSDRSLPRSLRTMEGFGVHSFRLVDKQGKTNLVKFHWKPAAGVHSVVWDEAQKISGKDPDFHRRDLWEAIERGDYPEWELGVQVIPEADVLKYGFDLLDATKLLPEELVPVRKIGKMTLNRNTDDYFAETEQVAFCTANLVPGIDVTEDPLLQARHFSYLDTQLTRLGGPNFAQIPINRPLAPVHNHQQDGFSNHSVKASSARYHPNSVGGGCPFLAGSLGTPTQGFVSAAVPVQGFKTRDRSETFDNHFSQARMFLHSMSVPERQHMVEALHFELGKVERKEIRARMVGLLERVDPQFAQEVAAGIGVTKSEQTPPVVAGKDAKPPIDRSPALSQANQPKGIKGRKVAVLVADGFAGADLAHLKTALEAQGATFDVVAADLNPKKPDHGAAVEPNKSFLTSASVFYDAVFVPGGAASVTALRKAGDPIHFVLEAFKHCKTIGGGAEGGDFVRDMVAMFGAAPDDTGIIVGPSNTQLADDFATAMAQHRHWDRATKDLAPA